MDHFEQFRRLTKQEIWRIRKAISEDPSKAKNLIQESLILSEKEKAKLLTEVNDEIRLAHLREICDHLKKREADEEMNNRLHRMEKKLDEFGEILDEIDQKQRKGAKWDLFSNLVGLLSLIIALYPYMDQALNLVRDTLKALISAIIEALEALKNWI